MGTTDGFGSVEYVQVAILEHLSQSNPHVLPLATPQSNASRISTPVMSNR